MKRHEVCGILPFIAAGALGGLATAQTLSTGKPNTAPVDGGIAGPALCCGDCEYALDDGTSETTVGAGVPIVWYNYLTAGGGCTEVCAISVAFGSTGFPDGSPITVLVYEDPTDDNDPSDAVLLASADGVAANTGTDTLNCYNVGPVQVSGGFFAVVVALDLGADTFPAAIDQTATQGQSWAGFGFTDPADPLADGTQGIIDGFGIPGNWLLRAYASGSLCPADTNGDGAVDVQDLTNVILDWGSDGSANGGDVTGDGTVDVSDLTDVILQWGPCPLENDECDGALTVGDGSIEFSNAGAGAGDEPWSCGLPGPDVWWNYTAAAEGVLTVDTCGSGFDTVLEIYAGTECLGESLGCNDDACDLQSSVSVALAAGEGVKIRVGGWNGAEGDGILNVAYDIDTTVPENDACADAIALAIGEVAVGDTTNATGGGGPGTPEDAPFCGVSVDSPGVWYTVVGNGSELTASLCNNTNYDAKLHVYCNNDCGNFNCVGGDDDGCGVGGGPSTLTFCSVEGDTYHILVEGWEGSTGAFDLQVTSGAACDDPTCISGNFACEVAAPIADGDVVDATTCDGAVAVGAPICPGGQTNLTGQWYVYTGDGNTATLSTCGSPLLMFDLDVDIYCAGPEGSECASLECTEALPGSCNLFFQEFDFCTVAGNTYYIHVYGVQPGGFDECGDYQVAVSSDGIPCDDFTTCDQPGCADPAAQPPIVNEIPVVVPVLADITQVPDGTLWVAGITDSLPDPDGCQCAHLFDPDTGDEIGTVTLPVTTNGVAGLAYDSVNDTIWCQDNELGNQRLIEITLDGVETGNVIVYPPFDVNTTGLCYDPTGNGGAGTFWFVELTNDQLYEVRRDGTLVNPDGTPQTCLDDGSGLFGNGVSVHPVTGTLEVLVGEIASGDANQIVPVDRVTGETIGPVTGLQALQDLGETATRGFIRDRDDPNGRMWVTGRTIQVIVEIDPTDLE